MKIDLEKIDRSLFSVREGNVNGIDVALITPKKGLFDVWNKDNLHLRSIMVEKSSGEILSRGFNKFFNYHEREDLVPTPDFSDCEFRSKIDGSLLIMSNINGKLNIRTRGTLNALEQYPATKKEFETIFNVQYKDFLNYILFNKGYSFLCEHTTPTNIIVINYGKEPKLRLLGIIRNDTGELYSQLAVDAIGKFFNIERPEKYNVSSIADVEKLLAIKNIEGYVLYFNNGQSLKKLKTEEYLHRHSVRSNFNHNSLLEEFKNTERTVKAARNLKNIMLNHYEFEVLDRPELWSIWNQLIDDCIRITYLTYNEFKIGYSKYSSNKADFAKWNLSHTNSDNYSTSFAFFLFQEISKNENFSEKLEEIGLNFFLDSKFKAYKEKFLVAL